VIVDTGAQGSTGNPALLQALRRMPEVGTGTMTDINGVSVTGTMRMARKLSFDRVQLENLPILFADSPAFHSLGLIGEPALILGMQELRLFDRVAIDFESQRVLFDLPKPGGFAGALVSSRN
jgi:hypothetical protein